MWVVCYFTTATVRIISEAQAKPISRDQLYGNYISWTIFKRTFYRYSCTLYCIRIVLPAFRVHFNSAEGLVGHKLWVLTVSEAWCALVGVPDSIQSMMINKWAWKLNKIDNYHHHIHHQHHHHQHVYQISSLEWSQLSLLPETLWST